MTVKLRRWAACAAISGVLLVQACGGGGGSTPASAPAPVASAPVVNPPPVVAPPAATVTVNGVATFASVPSNPTTGALNYAGVTDKPVRGATVQAVSGTSVLATATTDAQGAYSFSLPANTNYFIRLRAELIKTSGPTTWNVSVKDNTAGDALWVVDGPAASSGSANSTRSIAAGLGWTGSRYDSTGRASGPFAMLSTVYDAMATVASVQTTVSFPQLIIFWSPNNSTASSPTNDFTTGEIGTSFFLDQTATASVRSRAIYVVGKEDDDTDEFDSAVVGHEYGHYLQSAFASDNSPGGSHPAFAKLDMTLAFSEGWATAWSSVVRGTPIYSDSNGVAQSGGFSFSLTVIPSDPERGWYREDSVDSGMYALYLAHGFAPIWNAMTGPLANAQDALGSIFSFAAAVRSAGNAAVTATLNTILSAQNIFVGAGADQWGTGEANSGGSASNLPIYRSLALNVATPTCFINDNVNNGPNNKLGAARYYRIQLTLAQAGARIITANFVNGRDVDLEVYQGRKLVASGFADSLGQTSEQVVAILKAGEVVIKVSDYITTSPPSAPNCATLTIQ